MATGQGDAMWGPELTRGDGRFALLRAPVVAFDTELLPQAGEEEGRVALEAAARNEPMRRGRRE
ncbi:hypothetical protein BHS07_26835 [Myxococcus xanthus]|uniref:Uncharacterized protein n=1 Tax=Myxococcus xanthus TaxID=34 RepID=A0AAE6G3Q0_MYXXA|nr:hypothetical protein BHS09_26265 [Myxococcus xanthus]QDE77476.1 hypothetical protein BHS08_26285 [Myxococcus xanthus]QDE84870.1 hypothetical protein BHS07_26835 [Myxococcus xanthus]QDE99022.1 hypothetical protein BHS05_26075 [Myxococcus xanthus]